MKTAIASLCAVVALAGCTAIHKSAPVHETLISHRGESHDAPENTIPAYRMAVERGFGFECDVYLSADGRVFTFHDGNLKRTSGGKLDKPCTEAVWETEISTLNVGGWGRWKGSRFDPTRPALLEEVCALARNGRWIYCEVKGKDTHVVAAIRKVLESQSVATPENFLFIAFSQDVCIELKRQLPSYKVYWLTGSKGATEKVIIDTLRRIGADGVDIAYNSDLHTKHFIRRIQEAGYSFHVWTIDDPAKAAEAFSRGVDTVTTNRAKYILDALVGK